MVLVMMMKMSLIQDMIRILSVTMMMIIEVKVVMNWETI